MTQIYIVRHGETEANTRGACLGLKDVPMNENGRAQIRAVADKLKDINFDAVYSSPLSRCMESAQIIAKGPIIMNYGFIERDFGIWDDMTFNEIREKYPVEYEAWQKDFYYYRVPEGEASFEVQERVSRTIDKLLEKNEGKKILIVTHLGTARHIISRLLGLSLEESWCFFVENGKYSLIQTENGKGLLTLLNI